MTERTNRSKKKKKKNRSTPPGFSKFKARVEGDANDECARARISDSSGNFVFEFSSALAEKIRADKWNRLSP